MPWSRAILDSSQWIPSIDGLISNPSMNPIGHTFKCIQNLITSHHLHCCHPGPSYYPLPLGYCSSLTDLPTCLSTFKVIFLKCVSDHFTLLFINSSGFPSYRIKDHMLHYLTTSNKHTDTYPQTCYALPLI